MASAGPEAQVRLRIDQLLRNADWQSDQIHIEEPAGSGRLDYRLGDLCILEAKAPTVSTSTHSLRLQLQQAQRYQRATGAKFAMVSDGELHFIQDPRTGVISRLYFLPSEREIKHLLADPKALRDGYIREDDGLMPYQDRALEAVLAALNAGQPRILIDMATGAGKTRLAAEILNATHRICRDEKGRSLSALFLVDRDTLEEQSLDKLENELRDLKPNVIDKLGSARIDVLVAQVATMQHRYVSPPFHRDYFDLIIVDEAHRSVHGGSWRKILEAFDCPQIGLTATPPRSADDETIAYFGHPVFQYDYEEAVRDGVLAPYVIHRVHTNVDKNGLNYDGILFESRDFGVSVEIENRDRKIAEYYFDHFYGRKCLLFAASTKHAESLWRAFNERFAIHADDYRAEFVLSGAESPAARSDLIKDFQDGASDIKVLINLNILTAGFDYPDLDLLFMCRYTRHKSLYLQMKGRGSRIPRDRTGKPLLDEDSRPLKDRFIMVDFVGVTEWENYEPELAVPLIPDAVAVDELPTEDPVQRTVEPAEMLQAEVQVEIVGIEIVSPYGLSEETVPSAPSAELLLLRAELARVRADRQELAAEISRMRADLDALHQELSKTRTQGFRQLVSALDAQNFPSDAPLSWTSVSLSLLDYPSLEDLNRAFDVQFTDMQSHVESIVLERRLRRYRDLVDKKYGAGLSVDEAQELSLLDQSLDDAEAGFYDPIIASLTEKLRSGRDS